MESSLYSKSAILRLDGPFRGRFKVWVRDSTGLRECLLTESLFVTLLYLCRGFLSEKTGVVDLVEIIGPGARNRVQKTVSRLREALNDEKHELIVHDWDSMYHLDVQAIEDGDGFPLCKRIFGSNIDAVIVDIINGIVEHSRTMNASHKSSAANSDGGSFEHIQTHAAGTNIECAS